MDYGSIVEVNIDDKTSMKESLNKNNSSVMKNNKVRCCLAFNGLLSLILIGFICKWWIITNSAITGASLKYDNEYSNNSGDDFDDSVNDNVEGPAGPPELISNEWKEKNKWHYMQFLGFSLPFTNLLKIAINDMFSFGNLQDTDNKGLAEIIDLSDVVTNNLCNDMIKYFEDEYNDEDGKDNSSLVKHLDVTNMLYDSNSLVNKSVEYFFNILDNNIYYVNKAVIIKFSSNGKYSNLHADNMFIDGNYFNNDYELIKYTGVVFLNTKDIDFKGGNLEFISLKANKKISPIAGNGIIFGADLDYAHRVWPVLNGNRYILRLFFKIKQNNKFYNINNNNNHNQEL